MKIPQRRTDLKNPTKKMRKNMKMITMSTLVHSMALSCNLQKMILSGLKRQLKIKSYPRHQDFSLATILIRGMKKDMHKIKFKKIIITSKWICSLLKTQKKQSRKNIEFTIIVVGN